MEITSITVFASRRRASSSFSRLENSFRWASFRRPKLSDDACCSASAIAWFNRCIDVLLPTFHRLDIIGLIDSTIPMKTSSLLATSLHGDKLSSQVQAKALDDRRVFENQNT